MNTLREIRDAALRLPVSERMTLLDELFESLDDRPGVRPEDLKGVLAARLAAIENGEEELIDGPAALAEIRRDLRRRTKTS